MEEKHIGFLLSEINCQLSFKAEQILSKHKLSLSQWRVLARVYYLKMNTSSSLANSLNYDKGAMTRMVQRLIDKLFIQKKIDPNDHRIYRLFIHPEFEKQIPLIRDQLVLLLENYLSVFNTDEREQFNNLLNKLLQRLYNCDEHPLDERIYVQDSPQF